MAHPDPRTPCLIGVAQHTARQAPAPEPLALWERVAREAAADAGAPGLLERLDSVQVVMCESWAYDDPAGRLSDRVGASPRHRYYSDVGGTVPQELIGTATAAITRGEMDLALVAGAESLATHQALRRAGEEPQWSYPAAEKPSHPITKSAHPGELAHGVFLPAHTYALLDVARRGQRGDSLAAERAGRAAMMAPMTEVAAKNPHAWFPTARSAEELATVGADNRMVAWPYTKHTMAVMNVDMAAGAILASTETADALGVPPEQRLYLRGWAYGEDRWHPAGRSELGGSPTMREVSAAALEQAGLGLDDVEHLDLYSCFASALRFATDALGLDPQDHRGLTVTGGLPYAGGPASNYMLHQLASMAERLRAHPGSHGLVTGVGMHMAKHAYAVWSTEPGGRGHTGPAQRTSSEPAGATRSITESYAGPATVASYTVDHGRDGSARYGLAICDLPDGSRAYARVEEPDLLADAESRELVGQQVRLTTDGQVNTARC